MGYIPVLPVNINVCYGDGAALCAQTLTLGVNGPLDNKSYYSYTQQLKRKELINCMVEVVLQSPNYVCINDSMEDFPLTELSGGTSEWSLY